MGCTSQEAEASTSNMTRSLTTQTFGVPSHGVPELIETSDKVARLSEAGHAYEVRLRELEHQFESKASELGRNSSPRLPSSGGICRDRPANPRIAGMAGGGQAKRKSRIIRYPQTIDPADRAIFDEFKAEILGIANRNQARMGGTLGQVKQIIDGAELVFAVYPDNDSLDGIGMLVLKGERLLKECFASGASVSVRVSAVSCVNVEQAVAADDLFGVHPEYN
jgi:hypothetical protein